MAKGKNLSMLGRFFLGKQVIFVDIVDNLCPFGRKRA
jgi:hypothetical protein